MTRDIRRRHIATLTALLLCGCVSHHSDVETRSVQPARSEIVTADEIRATGASNLYDALQRARPLFLALRPNSISAPRAAAVVVVQNRMVVGGVDFLRSTPVSPRLSVRRLSASEVYQLTGVFASSGGLEIVEVASTARDPASGSQ